MHSAIHAVPAPPGLPNYRRTTGGTIPKALERRLASLGAGANALLHLDYHPRNVLTDGHSITGVIDWTNARSGDPRADLARTTSILRLDAGPDPPSLPVRAILTIFEAGWRRGYRRSGGSPGDLDLFYAWAGVMMAHDLAAKRDAAFLARVRRWTAARQTRAIRRAGQWRDDNL
jgi:aminoglycoside phosphotransferase (APT) family kinase protein